MFSLLPLYLLGGMAWYENNRLLRHTVKDSLETICNLQIMNLEEFCENRKSNLYLIGQMDIVTDALRVSLGELDASEAPNKSYVDNLLQERRKTYDYLQSISLVNRDYILVSSSEEYVAGKPSALRNSKENFTRDGFYMGQVVEREDHGKIIRTIPVYESVYYEDELIGYLVEELVVDYFDTFRYELDLAEGCSLYITDKKRNIITAGTSEQGEDVTEYVTTKEERQEYSEYWSQIDWENEPSGSFEYEVNGVTYVTCYSAVKYTDWKICINANLDVYYKATRSFHIMLFSMLIGFTICMLVINFYFSKRLVKPLNTIKETLLQIRNTNDYSLRVDYKGKDEFSQLSMQINDLLTYVEQAHNVEQEQRLSLQQRADHDPLTGIYNKASINTYMDAVIAEAKEKEADIAVGFIDIDDFRNYNTLYGHVEGDRVLQYVANTLKQFFHDGVGRNGGDEFLFWCIQEKDQKELEQTMQEFLKVLNSGLYSEVAGKTVPIACSIGVAVHKAVKAERKGLIHFADEAMYQAKRSGKNRYYIIRCNELEEKKDNV